MDLLINAITEAAHEAIEQAAAEAAKAAALASFEREAAALKAAAKQQTEALRWRMEAQANFLAVNEAKKAGVKNAFLAGVICLFSGLVLGVGGTMLMSN